ncbi:MAG: class I SAM-dependent methyltransferase [Flaviflexus sp.]|uniref:class I SAM-dependent methyltransferase n=2 Tax=Flaviflexus sp. TaxID=1969482 RepID=UPI003F8EA1A4
MGYHEHNHEDSDTNPAEYWDRRYGEAEPIWTGKVNKVLADVASGLEPGRSLDLGCGEGGDVIWLAKNGWTALGIDISEKAIARARSAAQTEGLGEDRARFVAGDLTEMDLDAEVDLVSASFFQSPVMLNRTAILRAAAAMVAPGGHILVVSHASMPNRNGDGPKFSSPEEEVEALGLNDRDWEPLIIESRARTHAGRDGVEMELEDAVVLYRRKS